MNNNPLSLISEALSHAGEDQQLMERLTHLEERRITPDKELPPMEFLFRLFNKPCFPRGELVGLTGKPKSGKTFISSILMTLCFQEEVLTMLRESPEPLRVLWYDTEQSDESTQDILKNRIMPMLGKGLCVEEFDAFTDELFNDPLTSITKEMMKLTNITSPYFYNTLREQALKLGLVVKTNNEHGYVSYYRPKPEIPKVSLDAPPGDAPFYPPTYYVPFRGLRTWGYPHHLGAVKVYGVWFMVYSLWFMEFGLWSLPWNEDRRPDRGLATPTTSPSRDIRSSG